MKSRTRSSIKGLLAIGGCLALCAAAAQAAVITASDITTGSSTHVTGDGLVTLTPYGVGLTVGTFSSSSDANAGAYFGVVGAGNDNVVRDLDGNPATTSDRQAIDMTLDLTVGLSGFSVTYARADGDATSGIVISGFTANPGASIGTYTMGTLYIQQAWTASSAVLYTFSNLDASKGQTLRFSANDSNQTNAQFAVKSITYVPEPSAALLGALGLLALLRRRR